MREDDLVNILLVDDDEDCRMFIRDAMEDGNIRNAVYEVGSGKEALDFLHRSNEHADAPEIGLVYLDIEMPGMNGQEVLKAIRSDRLFDHVPIVMLTGLSDDKEKAEAARNGANSYAVKPHEPADFMKTVIEATSYWIDIHERPSSAPPAGQSAPARVDATAGAGGEG